MSDALISTPVAAVMGVAASALIVTAGAQVKKSQRTDLVPLMGVLGAFVFAAQMVNFSIPGTGSSGHIIGGIFLAAILGPWAAFLTISSVLIIQCLIFADGGLLALGCNIINMGAMSCLVAYPLIFKPLMKYPASPWRMFGSAILACVVALELGAMLVTLETKLSGVTALSTSTFLLLMSSIHLAVGLGEGLATGAVLWFVQRTQPSLLIADRQAEHKKPNMKKVLLAFGAAAIAIGGGLALLASADPDGLEWSIAKVAGDDFGGTTDKISQIASNLQSATAVLPDYESHLSGIIGAIIVMAMVWVACSLIMRMRKKAVPVRKDKDYGQD